MARMHERKRGKIAGKSLVPYNFTIQRIARGWTQPRVRDSSVKRPEVRVWRSPREWFSHQICCEVCDAASKVLPSCLPWSFFIEDWNCRVNVSHKIEVLNFTSIVIPYYPNSDKIHSLVSQDLDWFRILSKQHWYGPWCTNFCLRQLRHCIVVDSAVFRKNS